MKHSYMGRIATFTVNEDNVNVLEESPVEEDEDYNIPDWVKIGLTHGEEPVFVRKLGKYTELSGKKKPFKPTKWEEYREMNRML